MPVEITMPKLSDTMTEGTLVKWLKKEMDPVQPGDILAEVETDKATQELEAFEPGVIAKIVSPEGAKVPVGGLLVLLASPSEDVAAVARGAAQVGRPSGPPPPAAAKTPPGEPLPARRDAAVAGRASAPAPGVAAFVAAASATAAQPGTRSEKPETTSATAPPLRISPLARRIAQEKGVDLAGLRGSGPDGRIIKRDILAAAALVPASPRPRVPASPLAGAAPLSSRFAREPSQLQPQTVPLASMRQTIARRLLQAKQTIPHFYMSIDVVVGPLLALRQAANEQLAPMKLSVTDFMARATALTLAQSPAVNASFTDAAIIRHGTVHLGVAVALPDGLVVPVIRDAQLKDVRQISTELRALAEAARAGKLKAEQMSGGTFTLSNLGMYPVRDFQAIINPPEAAILAVGGAAPRPVVKNGQVVAADVLTLSLSADHRVIDGAVAAAFLGKLKTLLENPLGILI